MKPSLILLAVALVLGGLVSAFLFGGGDSSSEEIARAKESEILVPTGLDRGPATLADEPVAAPGSTDREAVVDRSALRAAREEERLAVARAKGPFLLGRVIDEQGFAVPNASVKLSAGGPAGVFLQLGPTGYIERTTTDANGAFKVPSSGLFGDRVDVRVRGRGFLAFDEELELPPNDGDQQVPVIELEAGVVLSGVVVDSEGQPVEGAEVVRTTIELENRFQRNMMFGGGGQAEGSGKIVTDAEGRFELGNEPEGEYVVLVTHESFPKGRIEGNAPYPGYQDNGLVVRLAPTAAIAGRIEGFPRGRKYVDVHAVPTELARDEELDGPAAIFMAAGLATMHTVSVEEDGRFLLEGLDPGRAYDLVAKVQNGMMQLASCSDSVEVIAGQEEALLTWDGGATVTFELRSSVGDSAITSSSVRYMWVKDDRGMFDFGAKRRDFTSSSIELSELRPSPSPGKLSMAISAPGYLDLFREGIEVDENAVVDLGTIALDRAPVLRVQVLEAGSDKPLSRARLVLTPDQEGGEKRNRWADFGIEATAPQASKGRTEKDGWCELTVSAARTATLSVVRTGYADQRIEGVVLPARGDAETTVRMLEGAVLEVQVLDTKGNPVAKAKVDYKAPSGVDGSATTSRKGSIKLKDLEVGEYQLRASRPDGGGTMIAFGGGREEESAPWERVSLAPGTSVPLVLRVPMQTNLSGSLTVNGRPLVGAEVVLMNGAAPDEFDDEQVQMQRRMRSWGGGESTKTDKSGRFRMEELDIGPHHLRVTIEPGMPDHIVAANLREGENNVNGNIEVGMVRGRVVGSDGKPVADALVTVSLQGQGRGGGNWWGAQESEEGVRTNNDGRFEIQDLPLDLQLIAYAEAEGYVEDRSQPFELSTPSLEAEVEVTLASGASIRVILVGTASNFERIQATRIDEDGNELGSERAFVQGSEVVLRDIEPGTWTVALANGWGNDDIGPAQEIVVAPGVEAEVTIMRR